MLKRLRTDLRSTGDVERDYSLEGVRGIAAVIVVLWHNLLGFFPRQSGNFADFHHSGLRAMPWFGAFNGTAAVTVFFVLSGLVLSRAYFVSGDPSIIGRGALKRWPRLAGPVIVVVVLSALLDRLGFYRFDQVGSLTGSPWLVGHLFRGAPPDSRGLLDALEQGALTFFRGDSYYDTSLWTMRLEMMGSYMVFGLALIVGQVQKSAGCALYIIAVLMLIQFHVDVNMLAFLAGMVIAYVQARWTIALPLWAGVTMAMSAFYLLGFSALDAGWYKPVASAMQGIDKLYLHIAAAAVALLAVDGSPPLKAAMNRPWSAFLGWISFPLYLVHVPVLCSIGSWTFLYVLPAQGPKMASLSAAVVTIASSFAVAVPLAKFNDAWTVRVDRVARRLSREASRDAP